MARAGSTSLVSNYPSVPNWLQNKRIAMQMDTSCCKREDGHIQLHASVRVVAAWLSFTSKVGGHGDLVRQWRVLCFGKLLLKPFDLRMLGR